MTTRMLAPLKKVASSHYNHFLILMAELLELVNPRIPFGTQLFNALARLTVSVAIEGFVLRRNQDNGQLEVFLRRRAEDDSAYPGQWHAPGTILRPGETYEQAFNRLAGEFGTSVLSFLLCDTLNSQKEARGHVLSIVFLVQLEGAPREDESHGWYAVDRLPRPMVDSHEDHMLKMAQRVFEERERRGDR